MRVPFHAYFVLILFSIIAQSCKVNTSENTTSSNQSVLVDIKDNLNPEVLEIEFKEYKLQNKKIISKPLNIYLFFFDETTISAAELIKILNSSQNVEIAQSNKKVKNRN